MTPAPVAPVTEAPAAAPARAHAPVPVWKPRQTDVIPGQVAANDPRLPEFQRTMARVTSQEYSQQLRAAMRNEVGAKRNDAAINALKTRLSGGN